MKQDRRSIEIRVLSPDEWPIFRELRLAALEEAPYAFSTRLAEWQGDFDTEARWKRRLTDVPFNAVAYLDGSPAGIASGTMAGEDGGIELISMWVTPAARGKGAGEALIAAVTGWARAQRAAHVWLYVREANERATALYARCGFADEGLVDQPGPPERRMVRRM